MPRGPLLGTNFVSTVWNLDLRGPLRSQKTCCFSSILTAACMHYMSGIEVKRCFFWLTQHPNNRKPLLFHRSGIYIVQQTGIKIVKKNGINMKIGTIFKNIMYRALCIFQLSGSIFWMLYSTETSTGHEWYATVWNLDSRPFAVPI